jgi:hypothetical protein
MRRSTLTITIVCATFIVFVFYSLLHVEPIHVTDERIEHVGAGVVVRGIATNTGADAQVAGLKVELFDSNGHKLAVETLALGKLAPGQQVAFVSPPINATEAQKFTIQVNHGANMYGN